MSHNRDHIITFSTPIREGSKIKVGHCVVALVAVCIAVGALFF